VDTTEHYFSNLEKDNTYFKSGLCCM